MVGVAQLVEPRVVIPVVVGSSPIVHPIFYDGPLAQLVEQETLNLLVVGSTPTRPTKFPRRFKHLCVSRPVCPRLLEHRWHSAAICQSFARPSASFAVR
jgi:hypothetical protein